MKGVVMEVGKHFAVVLDQKGRFIKMRNSGQIEVGCEVDLGHLAKADYGRLMRTVSIAAAFVIVLGIGIAGYAYSEPYSYVNIDINPSVEFTLNVFDRIIKAEGLNEEGKQLLAAGSFKNKTVANGVSILLKSAMEEGYIDKNLSGDVLITVASKNNQKASQVKRVIENKAPEKLNTEKPDNAAPPPELIVKDISLESRQEAKNLGITPGDLVLVKELEKEYPEVKENSSLGEVIKEAIKEMKKPDSGKKEKEETRDIDSRKDDIKSKVDEYKEKLQELKDKLKNNTNKKDEEDEKKAQKGVSSGNKSTEKGKKAENAVSTIKAAVQKLLVENRVSESLQKVTDKIREQLQENRDRESDREDKKQGPNKGKGEEKGSNKNKGEEKGAGKGKVEEKDSNKGKGEEKGSSGAKDKGSKGPEKEESRKKDSDRDQREKRNQDRVYKGGSRGEREGVYTGKQGYGLIFASRETSGGIGLSLQSISFSKQNISFLNPSEGENRRQKSESRNSENSNSDRRDNAGRSTGKSGKNSSRRR